MKTTSICVDGMTSPLIEAGPHDAEEAVVFVHGNPGSIADWTRLVSHVGEFARAIAMDMPGFGAAEKPENFDYSIGGYARHLGHLLAECAIRRVHLVLHDFGGPWGLAWTAANPRAIASITLINTGVLVDYRWHYLARIWQTPWLGELFMASTTRAGMHLLMRQGNPRRLPAEYVNQAFDSFDSATRRAVLRLYRNSRDTHAAMQSIANALRPLNLPAQVIWGAHDPYISVNFAERQRDVFPNAEVSILPDSGHWPFIDNPDAVANILVPFLRRQTGTDGVHN
jgi:pimeloyl-ACP methyl ester carboxylesterase